MANGKHKKSKKKIFIFGGLGLIVIALILIAFIGGNKEDIISVQVEKAAKRDITQTVSATGKINSEFKVVITPEATGEIVQLPVKEGDVVKKRDLLIKLKADLYIAGKQKAEASLQSAKASLSMRKAELTKVTSDFNRVKKLFNKGLSSEAELEASQSNFLTSKASFDAAQAMVAQASAALKEAEDQLSKTTIYSPMSGTVTQLNVELGERVLGSGYSQGTNIMTISDLGNMEATVDVDENDVVLVSVGDTARINIDAFNDKVFKGVVTQIGNSAQSSGIGTQEQVVNFEVKIKLIELNPELRPGMSCNATIETETIKNVVSVPIQSITARSEVKKNISEDEEANNTVTKKKEPEEKIKEIVFTVKDGKAKTVEVKTGISDDNYIQIKEGLKGGEEVVSGSYRAISRELNDGSAVRIENQKKKTEKN